MQAITQTLRFSLEFLSPRFVWHCCLCVGLCFAANTWAGHPANGGSNGKHPVTPLPENVLVPSVSANIVRDTMEGFNLILALHNFDITVPLLTSADTVKVANGNVVSGHAHLYINGVKVMRIYADQLHLPGGLFKSGINSITVSINNHNHETFTLDDKEIQSTTILNVNSDEQYIKSQYHWP